MIKKDYKIVLSVMLTFLMVYKFVPALQTNYRA